jgi:prolyl-tRNA editing enzyme YbaK/EbsC (Cys-tRNA(Pro) deacylase)
MRIGEPIEKANPDFVRERTGFSIGGVPPVGHPAPLRTVVDQELMTVPQLWAAAGTPHAVFPLTPADLRVLVPDGIVVDLAVKGG